MPLAWTGYPQGVQSGFKLHLIKIRFATIEHDVNVAPRDLQQVLDTLPRNRRNLLIEKLMTSRLAILHGRLCPTAYYCQSIAILTLNFFTQLVLMKYVCE